MTARGDGKYFFEPTKAGRIQITISTEVNGENKVLSAQTWKSTLLPKPHIEISGVKNNKISKNALAKILKEFGAKAKYDKAFPIKSQPRIESARFETTTQGNLTPGKMDKKGKLKGNSVAQIKSLRKNSTVTVFMKVRGLDGIPHNISRAVTIR